MLIDDVITVSHNFDLDSTKVKTSWIFDQLTPQQQIEILQDAKADLDTKYKAALKRQGREAIRAKRKSKKNNINSA